jgi:peptidoglycan/xylan/chitin deacetylase (PgdA/CDA1 family)/sulfur carrier protein ThiS
MWGMGAWAAHRRRMLIGLATALLIMIAAVAVVASGALLTAKPTRALLISVRVDGQRIHISPKGATVREALAKAGRVPRNGRLLAVVSHTVLDPNAYPAVLMLNKMPVTAEHHVRDGDRIVVLEPADAVEETARREVPIPYPDQDKVASGAYAPGTDGLAEEIYGVVSGEVASRTVLREPTPPRPIVRPAPLGASTVVTLTFDDGPDPTWTPKVLDILARYNIRAVFCMVGRYARVNASVARAVAEQGHVLCNHTENHASLDRLSADGVRSEIEAAKASISDATGQRPGYFRFPYGRSSPTALAVVAQEGLTVLSWTVDPADYTRPGTAAIVQRVVSAARPGSIVLMHDGGGDRSQTVEALPTIIESLRSAGYTLGVNR